MSPNLKFLSAVFLSSAAAFAAVAPDAAGFTASVQPLLSKNCYSCHGVKLQSGGLNLQAFSGAGSVTKDRAEWEKVLEKLRTAQMPPAGLPRPAEADLKAVTTWLTKEFDRQDRSLPPDPGRITARRLNRTEYNNSIRDLLAVDFQAGADFPPDDSGYGFDNIADVLSMSPSLMEKYVAAAEKVARAAVYGPALMKPTLVKHEPWYVDFDNTPGVKTDYDVTGYSLPSALHVMHRFPAEGDYDIAGLLRGNRPDGSEPMQVAFWIDGKQIQVVSYPIPAGGEVSGQRKEFRTHVTAGEHLMSATFLRIYEGLPVSFNGPNPSKLPAPVTRNFGAGRGGRGGAGRGGAGAGRGGAAAGGVTSGAAVSANAPRVADLNASNNDEAPVGNGRGGRPAVGLFVSNLEIVGPYNQVTGPSAESRKRVFVCGDQTPLCAKRIVTNLAGRIYRRPATLQETDQLTGLVAMVQKSGDSFNEGICLAMEKMLISPNFLFRMERDGKTPVRKVTDLEMASRLSYFLWSSTPDDELLRLANEQKLRRPEVLTAQVKRMLQDKKAASLVQDFGGQWLQFRGLESHEPDRKKFQQYTEYTRMSIEKETEVFFENLMREDRPVTDLLEGKYTFVNQRLAEFYGIPGVKGAEFRKVDLTGTPRQGVLTQASVLVMSSYANRTSPVLRGKWVLENLLNAPPPPPPPGVPLLDEDTVGTTASLRVQLEKHRANAVCASCHSRMDPLGFALENYDAIGQWRAQDGKFPIDASGQLPDGRKFEGAKGLESVLMAEPAVFSKAMTEKMLTYALGRGVEAFDRPAINGIVAGMAKDQYRFSSLILGIVNSLPFQERRTAPDKIENTVEKVKNVPRA